jgi:hypothetical protein
MNYIRMFSCKFQLSFRRKFSNYPTPFLHFCDYLPFEEPLALYLNNLNSLYPRMICTKFDWDSSVGSWADFFFLNFSVFLLFCNYLSLGGGIALHLNNCECQTLKDDLY